MSIHKNHEDPITPQTAKPPYLYSPIYLPLWQQSTKKEGKLILSWRRRGLPAGSGGELSGGVVDVVVRPVIVDRRGLLLDRSCRAVEVAGVAVEAGAATIVESVRGADVTGVRSG